MFFFIVKFSLIVIVCTCSQTNSTQLIYNTTGSIQLGLIISECGDNLTLVQQSLAHVAIWTVDRLNELKLIGDYVLGLSVYRACAEPEYLRAVLDLYKGSNENALLLGIVVDYLDQLPKVVPEFAKLLHIDLIPTKKFYSDEIVAGVKVMQILGWLDDIEVFASDLYVLKEFYRTTRRDWMCVSRFHIDENVLLDPESMLFHPLVFLGSSFDIIDSLNTIRNDTSSEVNQKQIFVIPFGSRNMTALKEGTLLLRPHLVEPDILFYPPKILASSLLFEIAAPIQFLTRNVTEIVKMCEKRYTEFRKLSECIHSSRTVTSQHPTYELTQLDILEILKIEHMKDEFTYSIEYLDEPVFTIGMFDGIVTVSNHSERFSPLRNRNISDPRCFKRFEHCLLQCENFKSFEVTPLFPTFYGPGTFTLRPEPWVYAFLSISLLGIILCFSIMCYILSRLCKKQVLEGSPILTILLLLDVIAMYASVLPFSFQRTQSARNDLYLSRALCITLPYTFAFALLLSRTILLANVSREVGFMSHVSGSVQGFLTLFIFAVQCSLSLQLTNDCESAFQGPSFASLMSYNAVLLILLIFVTPLIAKSKRNYCEGKYFTITIVLLACGWSCWLPAYAVLDEDWKDPLLCVGLIYTASIIVGCIFIPRTYLMTLSAARERFTNTLPSLATATSAMDIYRASTLHVYDCVNVAAIAAASLRDQGTREEHQPAHLHSEPQQDGGVDGDVENQIDVHACESPSNDKVTRF